MSKVLDAIAANLETAEGLISAIELIKQDVSEEVATLHRAIRSIIRSSQSLLKKAEKEKVTVTKQIDSFPLIPNIPDYKPITPLKPQPYKLGDPPYYPQPVWMKTEIDGDTSRPEDQIIN